MECHPEVVRLTIDNAALTAQLNDAGAAEAGAAVRQARQQATEALRSGLTTELASALVRPTSELLAPPSELT